MIFILDTADREAIRHINEFYPLDGVTTNPSIVSKEKTDFYALMKEIRGIIGEEKMLHIQTGQKTAEGMVEEAKRLKEEIGGNIYVKIPIGEEGLKATMEIKKQGICGVTMTAIFTPNQALVSAKAGADFVAPYVNRLDNICGDGTRVVKDIVDIFASYSITNCKVLAASFKNADQVYKCAKAGCHSITASADIFSLLISHPMTDAAVAGFDKDWKSVYGEKTILDF